MTDPSPLPVIDIFRLLDLNPAMILTLVWALAACAFIVSVFVLLYHWFRYSFSTRLTVLTIVSYTLAGLILVGIMYVSIQNYLSGTMS